MDLPPVAAEHRIGPRRVRQIAASVRVSEIERDRDIGDLEVAGLALALSLTLKGATPGKVKAVAPLIDLVCRLDRRRDEARGGSRRL